MTRRRRDAEEPTAAEPCLRLVLHLQTDSDTAHGTIGPAGESCPIEFDGWIGLMSAISQLRGQHTNTANRADDGDPDDVR
jgi:hypothetical protein